VTLPEQGRHEMPNICPACGRELLVTELNCPGCLAAIKGEFSLGLFARLNKDQQRFVLVFVRNRGNLRDVEHELGLSYPSVRARLDQVIAALGHDAGRNPERATNVQRHDILAALEQGEITAGEAVKRLRSLCF